MVFQLKVKNKKLNHGLSKNKPNKFRSIFTKVKVVAKNVIYVKGWSKSLVGNKKINFFSNKKKK
jgi:ribosomal protein L6P/L9E